MPYNETLAAHIRRQIGETPGLTEKKMFGGVGYLLHGNMACGVYKQDLIVRVGPARHAAALAQPYTHVFDITGRPMQGWVMVEAAACEDENTLHAWVQQGMDFAASLPPK